MADETCTAVYRIHVWICRISPMIWRRLLVRSDSSIADLHYTLQTAFGWSDEHLHRFHIHGQDYGVSRVGGIIFSADPAKVRLSDFKFRLKESFRYEYDFVAGWEHQVHVEGRLALEDKGRYPRCIGGRPVKTAAVPWTSSRAGTKYRWTLRNYLRKSKPIWKRTICRPFVIGLGIWRNCTNG